MNSFFFSSYQNKTKTKLQSTAIHEHLIVLIFVYLFSFKGADMVVQLNLLTTLLVKPLLILQGTTVQELPFHFLKVLSQGVLFRPMRIAASDLAVFVLAVPWTCILACSLFCTILVLTRPVNDSEFAVYKMPVPS